MENDKLITFKEYLDQFLDYKENNNLSYEEMTRRTGLSRQQFYNIVNGKYGYAKTLEKLEKIFF